MLLAENVPNINIEILSSGHLIGMEKPVKSNSLIAEFLRK